MSTSRRTFLSYAAAGTAAIVAGGYLGNRYLVEREPVFLAKAVSYDADLVSIVKRGLVELGVDQTAVKDKRVLIKPNLVEPHAGAGHINTHPKMVRAVAEALLSLGAARVAVGEGPGHRRDALQVLEDSGLAELLHEDKIPFHDLNHGEAAPLPNRGQVSRLGPTLYLPTALLTADIVVSLAKMKTHHWAGATLSMKNLYGTMPGVIYGFPKNVLHWASIPHAIADITASAPVNLAIVDGIVGMEGDGPIMGTAKEAGVIAMGLNLPAVDATCCRVMGINPVRLPFLHIARQLKLGPIADQRIEQRGEPHTALRTDFELKDFIPAHQGIRLG